MTWFTEIHDASALRDRAAKTLTLQVGLANPFWLAFGAAASAGAAWWMLTRWSRPVNLEALAAAPPVSEAVAEAVAEPVVEAAPAVAEAPAADDLTRLTGVGPRTAAALAERGVTRFAQLAAWTAEEMAAFDAGMKLKGRSLRDGWIDQAARLAAEV